jgi:carboxylesterase type B
MTGGKDTSEGSRKDAEDCLYLHTYVPRDTFPHDSLPVIFSIFGGGFVAGDAWEGGILDGAGLAKMSRSIAVVPNFRVGILGHMALHSLKDSDPKRTTGNYGLQDQRAALVWVQNNIRMFGGDPNRVSMIGISSGAFSVHYHRLSPASQPLFSGSLGVGAAQATEWWYQPLEEADAFYSVLAKEAGCPTNIGNPGKVRDCLTRLSLPELFNATTRYAMGHDFDKQSLFTDILQHWLEPAADNAGIREFSADDLAKMGNRIPLRANPMFPLLSVGPCIDGSDEGLPAPPKELLRKGKFSKAPAINIFNKDEGSMFAPALTMAYPHAKIAWPMTHDGVDALVSWMFPSSKEFIINDIYSRSKFPNPDTRADRMITEAIFSCSNRDTAIQSAIHGVSNYLVEWQAAFTGIWRSAFGSSHAEAAAHLYYYDKAGGFWPKEGDFAASQEQAKLGVWLSCTLARLTHCGSPECSNGVEIPSCMDHGNDSSIAQMRPFNFTGQGAGLGDERLVVGSASGLIPGISASKSWAHFESFPDDLKRRCEFWRREEFEFVPTFYNEKPLLPSVCMGSIPLPGSTHWWKCGDAQHSCLVGKRMGCCCNVGRKASHDGSCIACSASVTASDSEAVIV